MNARIKELANQARIHYPTTEWSGEYWIFDEEKFAELIVNEVIEVAPHIEGIDEIKQHFGMK